MIARWTAWLRGVGRWFSRSERVVRWLGLSRSEGTESEPGLLLIQIDGLSQRELKKALAAGEMPHLQRLIDREHYRLHSLYAGLPSSTPAVQGELFYGQPGAVPGFNFRDRQTGEVVRMFDADAAQSIEQRLSQGGRGLMEGGSAYGNIYSGGAKEPHFCAATIGWSEMRPITKPFKLMGLVVVHLGSVVRVLTRVVVEAVIALVDLCRGMLDGRDLWKELQFVLSRVAVSIALREVTVIGATLDVTRGLPIVQVNFLGYDEQAHRRGPASAFAHWSLKGIDRAVEKLWCVARRSARRDYDIWIYGDHGQEQVTPYEVETGQTLEQAIQQSLDRTGHEPGEQEGQEGQEGQEAEGIVERGIQSKRAGWLRRRHAGATFGTAAKGGKSLKNRFKIAAMGPIGQLYLEGIQQPDREALAVDLTRRAGIPLVLLTEGDDQAKAFTAQGTFLLPAMAEKVLGKDHPFLDEVARDLVTLCHHRDAGDLMLSGWRTDGFPLSFPIENGAHAGPGRQETQSFALLPEDAPLPTTEHSYLRPRQLRQAAFHLLGRELERDANAPLQICWQQAPATANDDLPPLSQVSLSQLDSAINHYESQPSDLRTLRVMTYNVHACIGMDGKLSPRRIARVIRQSGADVVALQELDVGRRRTGDVDQAQVIAHLLEMDFHFHPAWELAEERYGNAILSRFPIQVAQRGTLPQSPRRRQAEPRSALWGELTVGRNRVQLINTHLGLSPAERRLQVEELLGPLWLARHGSGTPLILCGDLNASPRSICYKLICGTLADAQRCLPEHRPAATWFSSWPVNRIDHMFLSPGIQVCRVMVPRTGLARIASDHLPLVVDLQLPGTKASGATVRGLV